MRATDFIALRQRCLTLIDEHYRNPCVGPAWLARELYVSRRQLDRAFVGGPGVAEVLAKRRLKQVVALAALNPTFKMAEIATYCGYSNYETFRAQCHRYLRRKPRDARRDRAQALRSIREPSEAA